MTRDDHVLTLFVWRDGCAEVHNCYRRHVADLSAGADFAALVRTGRFNGRACRDINVIIGRDDDGVAYEACCLYWEENMAPGDERIGR